MYTVIATAYRSNYTTSENRERNHDALRYVKRSIALLGKPVQCEGYYKEGISDTATREQSFIFTVATRQDVKKLVGIFCVAFAQDCILVVGNGKAELIGSGWAETIGSRFQVVTNTNGLTAYTKLKSGDILKVI